MDKIILADGSEIQINEGSSISSISVDVSDLTGIKDIYDKLTKENLSSVKIKTGEEVTAVYSDMAVQDPHFKISFCKDHVRAVFGLRSMTESEKKEESIQDAVRYLSDEQALTVVDLLPKWENLIGKTVLIGTRFTYGIGVYKTIQDNLLIQEQYIPGNGTGALYIQINETNAGTEDDPIPVPENVLGSGFEYEYGKYYVEGENVYLCKRQGVENPEEMYGEIVKLYYPPSQLVGQYFEVMEKE